MPFEVAEPGLFVIRYEVAQDLEAARQSELIARVEQAGGPVVMLFELAPSIRMVPMEVPTFWLGVTGRAELSIRGMAIISSSAAVRVAAGGFALANLARGIRIEVKTYPSLEAAIEWARGLRLQAIKAGQP